jgi:hypothetical protein
VPFTDCSVFHFAFCILTCDGDRSDRGAILGLIGRVAGRGRPAECKRQKAKGKRQNEDAMHVRVIPAPTELASVERMIDR